MLARAQRGNYVHLALMLAALGLAYAIPFELLILARTILGPAHYTTEISWLHDRGYFLKRRTIAAALAVVAVGAALIHDPSWFGFAVVAAFVVSAAAAATRSSTQTALLLLAAVGLAATLLIKWPALAVAGVLLTTLAHVSVFTLIFMGLGAWQAQSRVQLVLIGCYLAAIILLIAFPPSNAVVIPAIADIAHQYASNIGQSLGALFGVGELPIERLIGLLAFIYTYHYLNWFIKAEVIRWTNISPRRWAITGVVTAASIGLYFYDFALGFSVVLVLSLMHVVLEFPLNALATRQLVEAIGGSLFGGPPRTAAQYNSVE